MARDPWVGRADVVDTLVRWAERYASPGMLPDNETVLTLYSKKDRYLVRIVFVTWDHLECTTEFDLRELDRQGRGYIDTWKGHLEAQIMAAREERVRQLH